MNIVCCTDHNYIMPTGVMICSVCINHPDVIVNFYIICNSDVTEQDKTDLEEITSRYNHQINFINAPIITKETECFTVNKKGQPKHITIAAYYRLFLAELLPSHIDKVIYLDGDIIVRHSLKRMYETNIENTAIGVVTDMDEGSIQIFNNLRYEEELGYFNSGVLLINLKFWRMNNLFQQFIEFATKYPERIRLHDQDILNYVLRNNKKTLHLKYNVQDGFFKKVLNISWKYEEELKEAIDNPFIIHFTCGGINKPWNQGCKVPYKEEYFKYRSFTKWKDEPLKKISQPIKTKIKNYIEKTAIKLGLMSKPEYIYII